MTLVAITRLHLRSVRFLIPFLYYVALSTWQAWRTYGNLDKGDIFVQSRINEIIQGIRLLVDSEEVTTTS